MPPFKIIAFDGDDTLWHTERLYVNAQESLTRLLAPYQVGETVAEALYRVESRNIRTFGYGIKSFTLSMIETAVDLTRGSISGVEIQEIINLGRGMLVADVELLEGVMGTIAHLAINHSLMLITKGDLQDQQGKISRSGLEEYFHSVEIVSEKTVGMYSRLFKEHSIAPAELLMVGNSLRSDILPILELGGQAIFIPYTFTWEHESADKPPAGTPGFHQVTSLNELPGLLEKLEQG